MKNACLWILGLTVSICTLAGCDATERFQRTVTLSTALEANRSLEASTHNGAIRVSGIRTGDCELKARITGRGLTVEDARKVAESISIRLASVVDGLAVRVDKPELLKQRYFSIEYDITLPVRTRLDLHTHNGSVTISDIQGEIRSETHNGAIRTDRITGPVHLSTHNGSVDVLLNGQNRIIADITTHNGSIDLKTPEDVSARMEASTHNGRITVSRPIIMVGDITKSNVRGTIGTGLGRISLRTHNGSITVR